MSHSSFLVDGLAMAAANLIVQAGAYLEKPEGGFLLKDGSRSECFVDLGLIGGRNLDCLARMLVWKLRRLSLRADVLVGPPYKAIPLAAVMSVVTDIPFDFYRKEEKDYGEGGVWVTKALRPRCRALLVDDVCTAGTAKREALEKIRDAGACPVGILVVVDRTPAEDLQELEGIPVYSLTSLSAIRRAYRELAV